MRPLPGLRLTAHSVELPDVTAEPTVDPPAVSGLGVLKGIAFGLAGGLAAGAVWFLVVLGTSSMTTYLLPVIGLATAYGVYFGMRRPGGIAAVIAVVVAAATVALSLFYVERHLVVSWFSDNGDSAHIPLVPYVDWVQEVIRHAFAKGPGAPIYSALSLVAAAWFGVRGFPDRHRHEQPGQAD